MCNNLLKKFLILFVVLLTACQSGSSDDEATTATTGGTTGGGTGGTGGTTTTVTISAQAGLATISAGGSTNITATLTDQGQPYLTATDVNFSSTCIGTNQATVNSPVTSNSGIASTTYTAQGCTGNDTVTVSADVDGTTISSAVTINILPATLGSIEFVSATPTNIALKGMGGAGQSETSTVQFRVLDTSGNPIANQSVTFTLNTSVGGLQFSPGTDTDVSGIDGTVSSIVQSGTVATPVRVTATVDSTGISTQSDQLVVTTGIPDNDSFSLAAATLNPETWNTDGVTVAISAFLADRFNNPVPDGTAVLFTTEGGSIGGSCVTANGSCSVNWVSQNPRPFVAPNDPNNGRVTIMATAVGEESFTDQNGNGSFDAGEPFDDLAEAFEDDNENGTYEAVEPFADFNVNGTYDAADGTYNGVVCTAINCTVSTLNVRRNLVLVMSGSNPAINFPGGNVSIPIGSSASVTFTVVDVNGQVMPAGTTISVATSNGTLQGPSSFTVPSTNVNCVLSIAPCTYSVSVKADTSPTAADSGPLTVTVTTPGGLATFSSITVTDF